MEITVTHEQARVPVTVLHLKGNFDTSSADLLVQQVEKEMQAGGKDMLVDLTEVPYMSSAGLRAINSVYKMVRGTTTPEGEAAIHKGVADGSYKAPHLKLLNPNKNVKEVLHMTGYDMFIEIHQHMKEALASY
jgi:anti-sigma B factor antagonist